MAITRHTSYTGTLKFGNIISMAVQANRDKKKVSKKILGDGDEGKKRRKYTETAKFYFFVHIQHLETEKKRV